MFNIITFVIFLQTAILQTTSQGLNGYTENQLHNLKYLKAYADEDNIFI